MERYEHEFFNEEIRPLLIVINVFFGVIGPIVLILGLANLLIRPLKVVFGLMNGDIGAAFGYDILWFLAGVGLPALIVWSMFGTWSRYRKGQYRQALYASLSPLAFAGFIVGLAMVGYVMETIWMLF